MKNKTTHLKYSEAIDALVTLRDQEVMRCLDDLSVKEKLRINRPFTVLEEIYNDYEKKRVEFVNEYADKDEDGNIIQRVDENGNQVGAQIPDGSPFFDKINELLASESDTEIPVLAYGGLVNTKLPFRFLKAFEKVFVEG